MLITNAAEMALMIPEGVVAATALFMVFFDALSGKKSSFFSGFSSYFAFGGVCAALAAVFLTWHGGSTILFAKSLLIDAVSQYFKGIILFCGVLTIPLIAVTREIRSENRSEFLSLMLLMVLAAMILVSSQNLFATYLSVQMSVLTGAILIAFRTRPRVSSEAGLKYFIFTQILLLVFLFGIILVLFQTHSVYIGDIRESMSANGITPTLSIVMFSFLFVAPLALGWIFPFQSLAPDISQGAPIGLSAFILAVPLTAGLATLLKICVNIFGAHEANTWVSVHGVPWRSIFGILSALTISVGTLGSVMQNNVKRFLGYCAISHVGFILLGLTYLDKEALVALLTGLLVFCIAIFGIFAVLHRVVNATQDESFSAFRGLAWRDPLVGVAACVFLLSLSALPPFAGFASRFELLGAVVRGKLYWLAAVVTANWVIGLVAYGRLAKEVMCPIRDVEGFSGSARSTRILIGVLLIPTFVLGFAWDVLHITLSESIATVLW